MDDSNKFLECENKVLSAFGVDYDRCMVSEYSTVGDIYYYHFNDYDNLQNDVLFDEIIKNAATILGLDKISRKDIILDIVKMIS